MQKSRNRIQAPKRIETRFAESKANEVAKSVTGLSSQDMNDRKRMEPRHSSPCCADQRTSQQHSGVEGVEPEREHAGRPARRGQLHLRAAPGIGKILAVFGDENAFCIISKKSVMFESNL